MVRPLYVPYCPTTNAKWGQLDYGVEIEFAQKRNHGYDFNAKWGQLDYGVELEFAQKRNYGYDFECAQFILHNILYAFKYANFL